jgi:hypothetical protein
MLIAPPVERGARGAENQAVDPIAGNLHKDVAVPGPIRP